MRPGAALLPMQLEIGFRDRGRFENSFRSGAAFVSDHAVEDDMVVDRARYYAQMRAEVG